MHGLLNVVIALHVHILLIVLHPETMSLFLVKFVTELIIILCVFFDSGLLFNGPFGEEAGYFVVSHDFVIALDSHAGVSFASVTPLIIRLALVNGLKRQLADRRSITSVIQANTTFFVIIHH